MGIADGVQLIAGGIENVLQRLRVSAVNVTIRLEIPGPRPDVASSLVVVRVDDLSYTGMHLAPPVFAAGFALADLEVQARDT